jgi:hypothetical protein
MPSEKNSSLSVAFLLVDSELASICGIQCVDRNELVG